MTEQRTPWVAEKDLELIDALHLSPRASFERLGPPLGVSAVTVARRWRKLVAAGAAWVSSFPGPALPVSGALVRIGCAPSAAGPVSRRVVRLSHAGSVHITTGEYMMYALVAAADPVALESVVLDVIGTVTGVKRVDTAVVVELYGGTTWTLGALDPDQRSAVSGQPTVVPGGSPGRPLDADERQLYLALQDDGRAGYRDLAVALGWSEKAVKRVMESMVSAGRLGFRADFVRPAAGWPVQVAMWLRVDDAQLTDIGRRLATWPEVRVCAAIVAETNLFVTVQLHQLGGLGAVQAKMQQHFPGLHIRARQVLIRPVKSWGRVLGPDGRATDVVPVDIWAPPGS